MNNQARAWVARYRDGYLMADGESVTTSDERKSDHGWASPEQAVTLWRERGDFNEPRTRPFGNGKMQAEDVRQRPEFAALGVVTIWRTLTFEPAGQ